MKEKFNLAKLDRIAKPRSQKALELSRLRKESIWLELRKAELSKKYKDKKYRNKKMRTITAKYGNTNQLVTITVMYYDLVLVIVDGTVKDSRDDVYGEIFEIDEFAARGGYEGLLSERLEELGVGDDEVKEQIKDALLKAEQE